MNLVKLRQFLAGYGLFNVSDEEIVLTIHHIMEHMVFGIVAAEMRQLRSNPDAYRKKALPQ